MALSQSIYEGSPLSLVQYEGTVILTADIHGSGDPYAPELTATGVVPGEYILPSVVVDTKGRILYIEENQPNLPCSSSGGCGGAKIGDNIDVTAGHISIPIASTSVKGVVKIGAGFKTDGCCLSADLDIATETTLGFIMIQQGLDVDTSGNLTAGIASASVVGNVIVDETTDIVVDGNGIISPTFPYQDATSTQKGKMQIGDYLNDDLGSGIVSADKATNTTFGVVKPANTNTLQITSGAIDIGGDIVTSLITQTWDKTSFSTLIDDGGVTTSYTPDSTNRIIKITPNSNLQINNPTQSSGGSVPDGTYMDILIDNSGSYIITLGSNYELRSIPGTFEGLSILSCVFVNSKWKCILQENFQ